MTDRWLDEQMEAYIELDVLTDEKTYCWKDR